MTVNRACQNGHGNPTGAVAAEPPVADLLADAVALMWTVAATGFVLSGDVLSCVYSAARSWAEPRSLGETAIFQLGDRVCAALAAYLVRSGLADAGQSTSQSIRQWASGTPASVIAAELRDAANYHRREPGTGTARNRAGTGGADTAAANSGRADSSRAMRGRTGRPGFPTEYTLGYAQGAAVARSMRD